MEILKTYKSNTCANTWKFDDKFILLLCKMFIAAISIAHLLRAGIGVYYHEIDSYVLPAISMQYRHSLIITQEDIEQAKIDFEDYYNEIDEYDDLRSSKLSKINEDEWVAFYFPVYTMFCMPAKLILQLLNCNQVRAFTITNAVCIITALIIVYRYFNVKPADKLLTLILLAISPIHMYIEYISAEAFIFSLIIISLVLYSNGKYKSAALAVSIAGICNPTVMGIGIVMVLEYFVKMFLNRKNVKIFSAKNILSTIEYACFYMPCLIPFIFNYLLIKKGNPTIDGATLTDYGKRFISYLFSNDIGFFSFAPFTLLIFLALIPVIVIRKKYKLLPYAGFVFAPMAAYSLMIYIDCVPTFCARYIMWTYPTLVFAVIIFLQNNLLKNSRRYIIESAASVVTSVMLVINYTPMYFFGFNGSSIFLLENAPALYNPYYGTFYSRNDKINWPYSSEYTSYYFSRRDGNLRKMLFKSTDENKAAVFDSIKGSEESLSMFEKKLNDIPSDNKLHYLNIPPLSSIELKELTIEEKGIVSRKKDVLKTGPIKASAETGYTIKTELTGRDIYKIEIEFPSVEPCISAEQFSINICNNKCKIQFEGTDFVRTEENKFVLIAPLVSSYSHGDTDITITPDKDMNIEEFTISIMENGNYIMESNEKISFSGNMKPDSVIYPVKLEPMKYYRVSVGISNPENFSEDDAVYCCFQYDKRFNHKPMYAQIHEKNCCFFISSGDTTISTSPTYLKIYGETSKPIYIDSVRVELAE